MSRLIELLLGSALFVSRFSGHGDVIACLEMTLADVRFWHRESIAVRRVKEAFDR